MCEEQVCEPEYSADPGADVSQGFSCISEAVNYSEIYNQQLADVQEPARNEQTAIAGVFLYRIEGFNYPLVRIELDAFFQAYGRTTVAQLAERLHLSSRSLFSAILNWHAGPNGHVRRYLYRHNVPDGTAETREEQVAELNEIKRGNRPDGVTRYSRWRLPRGTNYRLILPRSQGLEEEIALHRTALVSGRLQTVTARLDQEIQRTMDVADRIARNQQRLGQLLQPYQRELSGVGLLGEFLNIAEHFVTPSFSNSQQQTFDSLQSRVETLKRYAEQTFGQRPTSTARQLASAIRSDTDRLYEMLEGDSRLNEVLADACQNEAMLSSSYMQTVYTRLGACYRVLLSSDYADHFIEERLQPVLESLVDNSAAQSHGWHSCLATIAGKFSLLPTVIGNLPGPPSLLMGILDAAMPRMIQIASINPVQGQTLRNLTIRTTAILVGLSGADETEFIRRMSSSSPEEVLSVRGWSERVVNSSVMGSLGWGVFMSVITGVLFLNAFVGAVTATTDSLITRIRLWADATGQFANFSMSLIVALQRFQFVQQGFLSSAATSRCLGVVGSLAAIASSSMLIVEESRTRDYVGVAVAGIGLASGILSLAGFLVWMSAGTAPAPPVAAVLFIAAAIVGLVGAIVAWFASDTNNEALVEGLVESLPQGQLFARHLRNDGMLNRHFETVRSFHHRVSIEELQRSARETLNHLFGVSQISDREQRQQTEELIDSLLA